MGGRPDAESGTTLHWASVLCRRNLLPEFVEGDAVEEGRRPDGLAVAHRQQPDVAVFVGLTVVRRPGAVKMSGHGVTVGIDSVNDTRAKAVGRVGKARAEWSQHLIHQLGPAMRGAGSSGIACDRPFDVVGDQPLESTAVASLPGFERCFDGRLVLRFHGSFLAGDLPDSSILGTGGG